MFICFSYITCLHVFVVKLHTLT